MTASTDEDYEIIGVNEQGLLEEGHLGLAEAGRLDMTVVRAVQCQVRALVIRVARLTYPPP